MRDVKKHGALSLESLLATRSCARSSGVTGPARGGRRAKRQSIRAQIKGRGKEVWEAAWRVFRSARR